MKKSPGITTAWSVAGSAVVLLVIGVAASARAADILSGLLPADPLAVVRATGLAEAWDAVKASAAVRNLEESAPPKLAADLEQFRTGIATLEQTFIFNVEKAARDFLGSDCVIAFYGDDRAVFISVGDDQAALMAAANAFVGLERAKGEVRDESTFSYKDVTIHVTTLVDPNKIDAPPEERYHCFINNALVVSTNLDMVRKVIEVSKEGPGEGSKELAAALENMSDNAFLRAYLDVDRLSEAVDLEAAFDGGVRHPAFRIMTSQLLELLPLIRYLGFSAVSKGRVLELRQTIVYDEERLPPELKALLPPEDAPLKVLDLAPDSAAVAIGNRVNKAALWKWLLGLIEGADPDAASRIRATTEPSAGVFGAADFQGVLSQLGDQVGVFATPGSSPDAPPTLSIAVELRDRASIPATIRPLAGIVALAEAQKPNPDISLEAGDYKGTPLTAVRINNEELTGKLSPTLCVLDEWMVLSTNAEAARAIIDRHTDAGKPFELPEDEGTLVHLCRIDLTKVRTMIIGHKEFLMKGDIEKGVPRDKIEQDFDSVIFLLGFFDEATFYDAHSAGQLDSVGLITFSGGAAE